MSTTNLFSGLSGSSNGSSIGPSEPFYGEGKPRLVVLHNEGGAAVQAYFRLKRPVGQTSPWLSVGGPAFKSHMELWMPAAGHELRAFIATPPKTGVVELYQYSADTLMNDMPVELLKNLLPNGQLIGFNRQAHDDYFQIGDFDALRASSAWWFLCYDPDPDIQALAGGTWEKYAGTHRKLHTGNEQLLLTTVVAYIDTGTVPDGGSGGGDTGGGGGGGGAQTALTTPVPNRYNPAVLEHVTNMRVYGYGASNGEVTFNFPTDTTGINEYEIAVNGLIFEKVTTGSSILSGDVIFDDEFDLTITALGDNSHSLPVTINNVNLTADYLKSDSTVGTYPGTGYGLSKVGDPPPGRTGQTPSLNAPLNLFAVALDRFQAEITFNLPSVTTNIEAYEVVVNDVVRAHTQVGSYIYERPRSQIGVSRLEIEVRAINSNGMFSTAVTFVLDMPLGVIGEPPPQLLGGLFAPQITALWSDNRDFGTLLLTPLSQIPNADLYELSTNGIVRAYFQSSVYSFSAHGDTNIDVNVRAINSANQSSDFASANVSMADVTVDNSATRQTPPDRYENSTLSNVLNLQLSMLNNFLCVVQFTTPNETTEIAAYEVVINNKVYSFRPNGLCYFRTEPNNSYTVDVTAVGIAGQYSDTMRSTIVAKNNAIGSTPSLLQNGPGDGGNTGGLNRPDDGNNTLLSPISISARSYSTSHGEVFWVHPLQAYELGYKWDVFKGTERIEQNLSGGSAQYTAGENEIVKLAVSAILPNGEYSENPYLVSITNDGANEEVSGGPSTWQEVLG